MSAEWQFRRRLGMGHDLGSSVLPAAELSTADIISSARRLLKMNLGLGFTESGGGGGGSGPWLTPQSTRPYPIKLRGAPPAALAANTSCAQSELVASDCKVFQKVRDNTDCPPTRWP